MDNDGNSSNTAVIVVLLSTPRRLTLTADDCTPGWEDLVPDMDDAVDED